MDKTLDTFFESQMQEWPMARESHEALAKVWSHELPSPKLPTPLRVQCNPARLVSTGAKIDKASIAARPCFLCAANRPKEQQSLALNEEFEWLANPFPILSHHYTIASKQHRPQRFLDAYDAMIQAAKVLPEGYIVFYNGPKCGASAPDHLHLQAGIAEDIPLVTYAKSLKAKDGIQEVAPFGYLAYLIHNAEDSNTFHQLYGGLPIPEEDYEPRMNVIAYRKDGQVTLIVIPRRAHRPICYNKEGDAKYLRLMADFQNYKKRVEKEKKDLYSYANEKLATDLLEVVDNFERALSHEDAGDGFKEGMEMIFKQLNGVLEKHGLAEIPALGEEFDPNFHNAVMTEETDEYESGKVSGVLQKGYTLNGKVIRPSMVKVVS